MSPAQNDAREEHGLGNVGIHPRSMPVVPRALAVDAAVSAVRPAYARSEINSKSGLFPTFQRALLTFVTRSASIGVIVIVCISF